MNAVNVVQKLS